LFMMTVVRTTVSFDDGKYLLIDGFVSEFKMRL
jgi:hypothetical protein